MVKNREGLCYRCEFRARAMEGGKPIKPACTEDGRAVMECDSYLPVVPVATGRMVSRKKDPRPRFTGILSCREQAAGLPKISTMDLEALKVGEWEVPVWVPRHSGHPWGATTLDEHTSLCWRCDWRARNRETGLAVRMECGDKSSKCICYMYKPTRPCAVERGDCLMGYRGVPELRLKWLDLKMKRKTVTVLYYSYI